MPAQKTIHSSVFNVNGFVYQISVSSGIVSQVIHAQSPVISPASALTTVSDVYTGIYKSFHKSTFDILLERSISLISDIRPLSTVSLGVGVSLPPASSVISCGSSFAFNINSIQIDSDIQVKSDIIVKYVVPNVKTVQFGTLEFQNARRADDDVITVISDERYVMHGVSEPMAYTRKIVIRAESDSRMEHDRLLSLIGQKLPLWVYGLCYADCAIANISDLHVKPKLNRFRYTVEFIQYVYNTYNTVTFAGLSLSNPMIPNSFDMSPEYSIDMTDSFVTSPVPSVTMRFAVECLTESESEYQALLALVGTKQTLTINGKTYPLCYISTLSAIQPRGGGNVWKYTVEFSKRTGEMPVSVLFNGISLPDAVSSGDEEFEILSNRTTLHSGAVVADISPIIANRFSFTCMANDKNVYNQLKSLIGGKYTLIVDGETYPKCYISSWSSARKIGSGQFRVYTWNIGFEQDTS